MNVRSVVKDGALDGLQLEAINCNASVCCLCETWLTESNADFRLNGFNVFRNDRIDKRGGGAAIFVRDNLVSREIHFSSTYEVIWCEILECSGAAIARQLKATLGLRGGLERRQLTQPRYYWHPKWRKK